MEKLNEKQTEKPLNELTLKEIEARITHKHSYELSKHLKHALCTIQTELQNEGILDDFYGVYLRMGEILQTLPCINKNHDELIDHIDQNKGEYMDLSTQERVKLNFDMTF
jgi:hypothetical protein